MSLFAQLSGTYTIGPSGSFSSFTAAVNALNSQGVSGHVLFDVSPGTYTESITINNYTGNNLYSVAFKSWTNDSSSVILQSPSGTSTTNNFVVKFNQAKNVIFSSMTIQRTGTNGYSQVIDISNSCNNLSFSTLVLKNNSINVADDFAALIVGKNLNSSNSSNIDIFNCKFINGSYGVFLQGLSSGTLAINNNIWLSIFENQYRTSIYLAYQNSPKIIFNIITSQSTYSLFRVVEFLYCNQGPEISNNKIEFQKGAGLFLTNSQGCCSTTGQIFNNFISAGGSGATAIYFTNSGTFNIYYNSINLYGTGATGMNISGSTTNHLLFANNILYSAGANDLITVASSTITPFDYCNYNNYKTSGLIGNWKAITNIATLAAWQSATSFDGASISVNPNYISNTDLHIQSSGVQRAGTAMLNAPAPTIDRDYTPRHNSKPDMGAHERSTDDLAISSIYMVKYTCVGNQNSVKITLKNNSNHPLSVNNLQVYYTFNGTTISELMSFSNLAPNDSIDYVFNAKISSSSEATFAVKSWVSLYFDKNATNDSIEDSIYIFNYPVVSLPVDTTVCHNNTITLDAGPGFDAYHWSTQDSSQTVTLSSAQLGLGGTFVSVKVYKAVCMGKDSTLVIFKDCTGFDELNNTIQLSVYPNPALDFIYVKSSISLKNSKIEIIDLTGRIVFSTPYFDEKINISTLKKGIYYLIVYTEQGVIRKSFIK